MNKQPTVFLVGGSDTGKTNFLGRLWLCLRDKKGVLLADHLPEDAKYIARVAQELLKGKFAGHTPLNENASRCRIPVHWQQNGTVTKGELVLPDQKGEEWHKNFSKRLWTSELEDLLSIESSCLLFIRAASETIVPAIDPIKYAETQIFTKRTDGSSLKSSERYTDEDVAPLQGNREQKSFYDELPTQVQLVDWLQCLREAFDAVCGYNFRPRVGIMIAAWDLVPTDQANDGPMSYLKSTFPMLWQFIITNSERFDFQVFSSSVAGVDLDLDELRDAYCDGNPAASGEIQHYLDGTLTGTADFTLPLAWALGI